MTKTLEKSGRTEDEALKAALDELGLERDDVSVEIIERAKSGFLGIGANPAVIRVSYEVPDEPKKQAEIVKEQKVAPVEEKAAAPAVETVVVEATGEDAEAVKAFLTGLLGRMEINADIALTAREDGGINVNLAGPGMGAIIGRRGETLDAIQHLTNYVVNRGKEKHMHISVDAENYRAKREESLVHLAQKMAAKVIKYKRSMALEPMNSYERHVIHTALQDYPDVSTSSTGTEPNRRVVISYDRANDTRRSNGPRNNDRRRSHQSYNNRPSNDNSANKSVNNKPQSREWA